MAVVPRGHYIDGVDACDESNLVVGDVYNYGVLFGQRQGPSEIKSFGLCLATAPLIDAKNFIGRAAELQQVKGFLRPGDATDEQRRLVLGGMGGIGKTQLAIAYARAYQSSYTSVFWLNAATEATLQASFRSVSQRLFQSSELEKLTDQQVFHRTIEWLADTKNTQWLLIVDNYDDPDHFKIDAYIPNTNHGSVIVTTRLPDFVKGFKVRLRPIQSSEESLAILQTRSQREDIGTEPDAIRLIERLGGLPLALATAGAYLLKTTLSLSQYLEIYDQRFNINPRRPTQLQEYQDRTLYTTWNLSYSRLQHDDPLAAKTLALLAYFDNQEIWFELLHHGLTADAPDWLHELATQKIDFENAASTLVEYCLLEINASNNAFTMHNCVHDWTLAELNKRIDYQLYWYTVRCVSFEIDDKNIRESTLSQVRFARLFRHALRCAHPQFQTDQVSETASHARMNNLTAIAILLYQRSYQAPAERLHRRTLAWYNKVYGTEGKATLIQMLNLAACLQVQDKADEAKDLLEQIIDRLEKNTEPDQAMLLLAMRNLGDAYSKEGKSDEAEQIYKRALAWHETLRGPDILRSAEVCLNLGTLYRAQGKDDEAALLFERALTWSEQELGPDHFLTLVALGNLGSTYAEQGRTIEAKRMYERAFGGFRSLMGEQHLRTLEMARNIAILEGNTAQASLYQEQVEHHLSLSSR